jgi:hypothetical protein
MADEVLLGIMHISNRMVGPTVGLCNGLAQVDGAVSVDAFRHRGVEAWNGVLLLASLGSMGLGGRACVGPRPTSSTQTGPMTGPSTY